MSMFTIVVLVLGVIAVTVTGIWYVVKVKPELDSKTDHFDGVTNHPGVSTMFLTENSDPALIERAARENNISVEDLMANLREVSFLELPVSSH